MSDAYTDQAKADTFALEQKRLLEGVLEALEDTVALANVSQIIRESCSFRSKFFSLDNFALAELVLELPSQNLGSWIKFLALVEEDEQIYDAALHLSPFSEMGVSVTTVRNRRGFIDYGPALDRIVRDWTETIDHFVLGSQVFVLFVAKPHA